jgi:hypothetical protein
MPGDPKIAKQFRTMKMKEKRKRDKQQDENEDP